MKEMVMLQQINLYNLLPHQTKSWFTWKKLYAIYGLFILLLIFKWGNALWERHQLTKDLDHEVTLFADTQQRFKKLMTRYPTIDTKNLQTLGESLRTELMNELTIVKLLSQSSKFSAYLLGLALATTDGAWLTDISFSANEPHIILKGNALQPEIVQQFLDQLIRQPVFIESPFRISDLTQVILGKDILFSFNITTKTKSLV
jgi:hypothetical protein